MFQLDFSEIGLSQGILDKILEIVKNFKLSLSRIEFKIIEEHKPVKNDQFKIDDFTKVTEIKDSILNYNRLNPNLSFTNFIRGQVTK